MHLKNTERIIAALGVGVSRQKLAEIEQYPDYGSLMCLSHCLDELRVNHITARLRPEQFSQIPYPAIAYCQAYEGTYGYFVLLRKVTNEKVHYYDTDQGELVDDLEDFEDIWTGKVIVLEVTENSGEEAYEKQQKKLLWQRLENRISFLVLASLSLIAFIKFLSTEQWFLAPLIMVSIGGAFLSWLTIRKAFGTIDPITDRICSLITPRLDSKQDSCNTLISSKTSKIFGWLGLGELGLVYFSAQVLLYIAFPVLGTNHLFGALFFVLTIAALPVVIFSILYQVINRIYCPLCLMVQACILVQLALLFLGGSHSMLGQVGLANLFFVFTIPLLTLATWFLMKTLIVQIHDRKAQHNAYLKFKHNSELFYAYLKNTLPKDMVSLPNDIVLGNPAAHVVLTMYSNPFCAPCTELYPKVFDLLDYFEEDLKLVVRFLPKSVPEEEKIVAHLLQMSEAPDIRKAIEHWYSSKDYDLWANDHPTKNYPLGIGLLTGKDAIEIHRQWAEKQDIRHTPVFYINGYLLRAPYKVAELRLHMRFLINEFTRESKLNQISTKTG